MDDKRKHANHGPHIRLYTHDGKTLPLKEWARHFDAGGATPALAATLAFLTALKEQPDGQD